MSWALQHVELMLEDRESGEVVVIETQPDGKVVYKVEEAKPAKDEKPAKEAKPAAKPAKDEKPAKEAKPAAKPAKDEKPAKEAKHAAKPAKDEKPAKEAKPAKDEKPAKEAKPAKQEKGKKRLAWRFETFVNGYEGYIAQIRAGKFLAVRAKQFTDWALFFEPKVGIRRSIKCFDTPDQAQKHAQELVDAGWPESEYAEITKAHIERACPRSVHDREEEPTMKPTAKTEEEGPKTERPAPKPEAKPEAPASADERLMRSFRDTAMAMVEEDDD